jgi:DNA repair protein RadC
MRELRTVRIRDWPAAERPRERLRELGAHALATRELIALLVGNGGGGRSALDIGAALLDASRGSIRGLPGAAVGERGRVAGVGPAVAARIAAAVELGRRMAREAAAERTRIRGPRDVHAWFGPSLRSLMQEEFRILLLTAQHAVLRDVVVTRGILDASVVHPREVFRQAIVEHAAALILVHNHPSGDPTPSAEDRLVTRQLVEAGAVLGIPVLDHVIVGDGRYISFAEAGLLPPYPA